MSELSISVITAASRPLETLRRLRAQFSAQTTRDFEHIVVYDGPPPDDVRAFFEAESRSDQRLRFSWLPEQDGRYGTGPRNSGIELAAGRFIVFADDDDLYHPDYLKAFLDLDMDERSLGVVRISNYGTVIPRHAMRDFPRECHVGTPSCCYPANWFREHHDLRWEYDGRYDHDFQLVSRCVKLLKPEIKLNSRVLVKAANERIMTEHGIVGTARERYLSWEEPSSWLRTFSPAASDRWFCRVLYEAGKRMTVTQSGGR